MEGAAGLPELGPDEGMWRYRRLLPLGEGPVRYPLPVGGSPLLAPPLLRERMGMAALWLKDETRGPTGSNKDRATALVVEQAMRAGARTVSCASTGNVAVSLAVGAAAAGLSAVVFVPAETEPARLTVMLMAGATVVRVRAGYAAAFELSRTVAAQLGWHDRNTGVNPATTEAKKTVALEIWEQLGRAVPDVVIAPVGDGPTLSALAKGFGELRALGAAPSVPRLVGVQAEGAQPVKLAWEQGEPVRPVTPRTIAAGIAVGEPISGDDVVRDVREAGGGFVAVSDAALLAAMDDLLGGAGVLAEPAAAASLAGLRRALETGLVDPGERVVLLVTGSGWKTPQHLDSDRVPLDVEGHPDEVLASLPAEVRSR